MASSSGAVPTPLKSLFEAYPGLYYVTSSSPDYPSIRATYALDNLAVPLAIVRPKTAEEVSAVVKHAISNGIDFVIRSGGNDLFGRSQVHGALTIDLRDIDYVEIDEKKSTAKVGGGILNGTLGAALSEKGLATAVGAIPFVGFTGWATYGGYGLLSSKFGLGVDQILGAQVVNAEGNIVDADEQMLKGIRGAGGNFGVIVELTIKVYPLKKILAGAIIFDSTDLPKAIKQFSAGYEKLREDGLPDELGIQQIVMNTPLGRALGVLFVWASEDEEAGQAYHEKVTSLTTVVMDTVGPSTLSDWQASTSDIVAQRAYGSISTINLRKWTPTAVAILLRHLEKMPSDKTTAFNVHELRGKSARVNPGTCFASREPHYMIEFIESAETPSGAKATKDWANDFLADFRGTDQKNLLRGTYVSLTPEGTVSLQDIYGEKYEELIALKRKYDPKGVFKNTYPRLLL